MIVMSWGFVTFFYPFTRIVALLRSAAYPVAPPQMLSRITLKTLVGPEVMTFKMSRLLEPQLWLLSPPHKVRTQEEVTVSTGCLH